MSQYLVKPSGDDDTPKPGAEGAAEAKASDEKAGAKIGVTAAAPAPAAAESAPATPNAKWRSHEFSPWYSNLQACGNLGLEIRE